MTELELLSPARNLAIGREAILHGADAVYIGPPSHGARAKASNTLDDIHRLVEFARPFGAKVYVTVNTIVYDEELEAVERMIWDLYHIGVDALIVQDLGILEMNLPPIALHASTQCDTRDPGKARFLADAGFSQIVVARELSLDEIRDVCRSVDVPVEAFVHGALCVSYSGDCQASFVNNGRSANRGECSQMCRLPYDLIDGNGNVVGRQRHYLSLRDMNRINELECLADAGVRSFKIEGRLKDMAYVKNVTAAYSQALDRIIASQPGRYCRSSRGISEPDFTPSLCRSFNRGYTDYFLSGESRNRMATFDSPKSIGVKVGRVISSKGRTVEARLNQNVSNGDGLTYISPDGSTGGFRVNRAEGNRLYLLEGVKVAPGTELFLSYDRAWETSMARTTSRRTIPVKLTLRRTGDGRLALDGFIEGVGTTSVTASCDLAEASKPVADYRKTTLSKLGGTIFSMDGLDDRIGNLFVPASVLTEMRRSLCEAMMHTLDCRKVYDRRREMANNLCVTEKEVTRHCNVSNRLARKFYMSHGAERVDDAIEVRRDNRQEELTVMTTRYCLRRELGACLKSADGGRLTGPLWLRGQGFSYRLDFDCRECRMKVVCSSRF